MIIAVGVAGDEATGRANSISSVVSPAPAGNQSPEVDADHMKQQLMLVSFPF